MQMRMKIDWWNMWCHMGLMATEITTNPYLVQANNTKNIKEPHKQPFVRGIHQW